MKSLFLILLAVTNSLVVFWIDLYQNNGLEYPFTKIRNIQETNTLRLDKFKTFGELKDQLYTEMADGYIGEHLILRIKDRAIPLFIGLQSFNCQMGSLKIKSRNIFKIDESTAITTSLFDQYIFNNGVNPKYSEHPRKAIISIAMEDSTSIDCFEEKLLASYYAYLHLYQQTSAEVYGLEISDLNKEQAQHLINYIMPYYLEVCINC